MKKFLSPVLIIVICSLFFVACSKDGDANPLKYKLIGKWDYVKRLVLDANGNILETHHYKNNGSCPLDYLYFAPDGTLEEHLFLEIDSTCAHVIDNGTWIIEGDKLTVMYHHDDGVSRNWKIVKLSDKYLELEWAIPDYDRGEYDSKVVSFRWILSKQ